MLRAAAALATPAPTRPDPVKLTARTSAAAMSAGPIACPVPTSTLNTPGGNPAAVAHSARNNAERDADSAGLSTTVLPNANAGAAFHSGMAIGKFQGVMSATTP